MECTPKCMMPDPIGLRFNKMRLLSKKSIGGTLTFLYMIVMILDRSFSFSFARWKVYCVSRKDLQHPRQIFIQSDKINWYYNPERVENFTLHQAYNSRYLLWKLAKKYLQSWNNIIRFINRVCYSIKLNSTTVACKNWASNH